jgi:hypothetical protein
VLDNSTDGIYTGLKTALDMSNSDYLKWKDKAHNKAMQTRFQIQFESWCQNMLEG